MAHDCAYSRLRAIESLVYSRRFPVDRKEPGVGQLALAKQPQVPNHRFADVGAPARAHVEGAVVLGQTLVEPEWSVAEDTAKDEMTELVKK